MSDIKLLFFIFNLFLWDYAYFFYIYLSLNICFIVVVGDPVIVFYLRFSDSIDELSFSYSFLFCCLSFCW